MKEKLFLKSILIFIFCFFILQPAHAGDIKTNPIKIIKSSELIIQGTIIEIKTEKDEHNVLYDIINIKINEVIYGKFNKKIIKLRHSNNVYYDRDLIYPTFKINEEIIIFLVKENENYWLPNYGYKGKFKVQNNKIGNSNVNLTRFKNDIKDVISNKKDSIEFFIGDRPDEMPPIQKMNNRFAVLSTPSPIKILKPASTIIEFQINPDSALNKSGSPLPFDSIRLAVQRAINSWNSVPHSNIIFSVSPYPIEDRRANGGDNTITFESCTCNGYVNIFYDNDGIISGADIVLCGKSGYAYNPARFLRWNADATYPSDGTYSLYPSPFGGSDIGPVDMEDVIAYELGHTFGLGHPETQENYTMVPTDYDATDWYKKTWRRTLELGDQAGKIYQSPNIPGGYSSQQISHILLSSKNNTTINGDFTVGLNNTLEIEANKTISFANNSVLYVYGMLLAYGTLNNRITFTSSSAPTKWGGIVFSGGGATGSVMEYCVLNNIATDGSAISVLSTGSPTIKYCEISGNTNATGIYIYNANPIIVNNKINNNRTGVSMNTNCEPYFGNSSYSHGPTAGNNIITNNSQYGVYAAYACTPWMGLSGNTYYSYNQIHANSSYNVYASLYCDIYARQNWWGIAPPIPSMFYIPGGCTLDTLDYLYSAPYQPFNKESIKNFNIGTGNQLSSVSDIRNKLYKAIELRLDKKYNEALSLYKEIISTESESKTGIYILPGLLGLYKETSNESIIDYLGTIKVKDPDFNAALNLTLS